MSKKPQKKDNISFKNDPFKTVKGFSALKLEVQKQQHEKVSTPKIPLTNDEDAEVDFGNAMLQLGVEIIATDNEEISSAHDVEIDKSGCEKKGTAPLDESDEAIFLASLGQLDTVFSDNYCAQDDEVQSHGAQARRMKQLRQGKSKPQDTLDLHGCYREEAIEKVRHFLQHRHAAGCHTVLIVTGQGKRSPTGEAVLRSDVEQYLRTRASAWVAEWGRAPRQYGGEGALVVFLRQRNIVKQG